MENDDLIYRPSGEVNVGPVEKIGPESDLELQVEGPFVAGFNERFLAYVIDCLPFLLATYLSFKIGVKSGMFTPDFAGELKCKLLWIAVYIVYQGVLSSGGRATLGKYIMGLRVVDKEGGPLPLGRGFVRGFSYFISSGTLNLGYLLALATPESRALHDYIAGSRVVSLKERGDMASGLILAASWGLMAFFIGSWVNKNVLKISVPEKRQIYAAHRTLSKLGTLERIYMQSSGHYTNNLKALANLTGNVDAVKAELLRNLEPDSLVIMSNGRTYVITAKARNWRKTEVQVKSPAALPPQAAYGE